MVPLLAAAGVADAAGKIVDGAASVWKHITSGAHGGAHVGPNGDAKQPGSFASLLAGQGADAGASGRDALSTMLAGVTGNSANASTTGSHKSATGTGAVDRVA